MTLRFIGTEADVHGKKLERFGQAIELDETAAAAAITSNIPILPDGDFARCQFTPKELERYAYPGGRVRPDDPKSAEEFDVFAAKWKQAREALHNDRESLKAGGGFALAKEGE
jgi:hypothetical protein